MYNIKNVINKMKQIAKIDSNASLARLLNISYNTLNTWIKRGKLPQEVIFSFCKEYECSLDYLLLENNNHDNFSILSSETPNNINNTNDDIYKFDYYGYIDDNQENSFNGYLELTINKKLMHSNSYYLLHKNSIFTIGLCRFDIFDNNVYIKLNNIEHIVSLDNFNKLNKGLIIKIETKKF